MTLPVVRLAIALFLVQAGFHGYTASLPLALAQADVGDATIGLIVGMAAVVQIPAAIVGGRLVDAFGGLRLFAAGGVAYLLASLILLLPGVEPGGSVIPFFAARALQGAGIAATLPAALSLVPRMLPKERTSSGIAFVGAAHNLTLVLLPPLSIAVLNASGTRVHNSAATLSPNCSTTHGLGPTRTSGRIRYHHRPCRWRYCWLEFHLR